MAFGCVFDEPFSYEEIDIWKLALDLLETTKCPTCNKPLVDLKPHHGNLHKRCETCNKVFMLSIDPQTHVINVERSYTMEKKLIEEKIQDLEYTLALFKNRLKKYQ